MNDAGDAVSYRNSKGLVVETWKLRVFWQRGLLVYSKVGYIRNA